MNEGDVEIWRYAVGEKKRREQGRGKKRIGREWRPGGRKKIYTAIGYGRIDGGKDTEDGSRVGKGKEFKFQRSGFGKLEEDIIGGKRLQVREAFETILKPGIFSIFIKGYEVFSPSFFK
jgi:hypothetical protein